MPPSFNAGAVLYALNPARMAAFYREAGGLAPAGGDDEHIILESAGFQLVILQVPQEIALSITVTSPPRRRTQTAVKLVFAVTSIAAARTAAALHGGELNPQNKEWQFQGMRVCDGHDPEGNAVQLRQVPASAAFTVGH